MTAARRLHGDTRGSAAMQFALTVPAMLMVITGLGEMAFQGYVQSVLTGAVQKAGRDSTLEGNNSQAQTDAIDAVVKTAVGQLVPAATFVSTRMTYGDYASIKGEPFVDKNGNGVCDNGESYIDTNANKQYDLNPGVAGQGNAGDTTQYSMKVTYHRLFPVGLLGWSPTVQLSATTLLKNQPYNTQSNDDLVRTC